MAVSKSKYRYKFSEECCNLNKFFKKTRKYKCSYLVKLNRIERLGIKQADGIIKQEDGGRLELLNYIPISLPPTTAMLFETFLQ